MRLHENRVLRHVARSHIYQSHKYSGTYPAYDVPRVYRFADQENGRGIEVEMQPQIIWGTSPCSMQIWKHLCWRTARAGDGRSPELGRRMERLEMRLKIIGRNA